MSSAPSPSDCPVESSARFPERIGGSPQTAPEQSPLIADEKSRSVRIAMTEAPGTESEDPMVAKKRVLAQLVVHDLRNPLSTALGYVQLIREELSGAADPGRLRDYLDDVTTLIDKALGLVSTILDVEEMEDGMLRARPTVVTFGELVRRAQAGHMRQYERRGLTLEVTGAIDAPLLLDVDLMGRVVENLLDNAARYAPRGGRVVASAVWLGDDIELAIGNSGPAVPQGDRETIFGRYYQVEARRASARANRGLGLYFCKLAVAAHGGTIDVESRDGLGAVFVAKFPQSASASASEQLSKVLG